VSLIIGPWRREPARHQKGNPMKVIQTVFAGVTTIVFASSAACAQQGMKGSIASVDEPAGTISIQQTPSGTVGINGVAPTDVYKVRDGLLFNAVRYGDKVIFSAETINGTKTITQLEKE
jgi:Cu/Ag efflux protein CusF